MGAQRQSCGFVKHEITCLDGARDCGHVVACRHIRRLAFHSASALFLALSVHARVLLPFYGYREGNLCCAELVGLFHTQTPGGRANL